jgi:5-methylcytosine-specific restriction endonuclease McrA
MGKEMLLNLQEHEMETTLTQRQKEYLESYRKCGSAGKTAIDMGVSRDTAAGQLNHIAKKLGFGSVKDICPKPKAERATASDLMELLKKQNYKCALTGVSLTPKNANLDHIFPRSQGGSDLPSNLQWILDDINKMKGSLDQNTFVELCGMVWRHTHPPSA